MGAWLWAASSLAQRASSKHSPIHNKARPTSVELMLSRFPPPWSVRRFASGLLIVLAFPGYPIWHLTKYCSSQEGWLGKIGAFIILSPIFAFIAVVWIGLWGLILGLFWRAVQGA